VDEPERWWRSGDHILVDLPDGQTVRCRVVNVKDDGTIQVVPEHPVVIDSWFKALADGTRVQLVSLLARAGRPMSVGEIVGAVAVRQSTVSAHLKVLAEVRFVLVEERGTARFYRINEECVACFPTAADVVMGRSAPLKPGA
jgi:DNA-binding transcriptional ArsR family regulator